MSLGFKRLKGDAKLDAKAGGLATRYSPHGYPRPVAAGLGNSKINLVIHGFRILQVLSV